MPERQSEDGHPQHPPRHLPGPVLMHLGSMASEPGFVQFLADAQVMGFGLSHPTDRGLSDEEWAEVSDIRVRTLIASYRRAASGGDAQ